MSTPVFARWHDWMSWVLIAGFTLGVTIAYPTLQRMGVMP